MKKVPVVIQYRSGKPHRAIFKTKGLHRFMGMDLDAVHDKLRHLKDGPETEAWLQKMSEAEDKAMEIRQKALEFFQQNPLTALVGWEFESYDHMMDGSYQFVFKLPSEPEYSI